MPPRRSAAQIQAELRRIQQRQRQAINYYNRSVRKAVSDYNAGVRRANQAVDRYKSAARAHNAKVRASHERLRREVARLNAAPQASIVRVTYRTSVQQFTTSFHVLEGQAAAAGWDESDVFAYSSAEAANSVAALNALLAEEGRRDATDDEVDELQATRIGCELADLDSDLDQRWRGALFALNPRNPDAARHFCTSARGMLSDILDAVAPSDLVLTEDPLCERTERGTPTRRSRIRYCLCRTGLDLDGLAEFVEADIDNVLALFGQFNSGTHGSADARR